MALDTTTVNGYVYQADGSVREKSYVIFEQTGFDTDADSNAVVVSTPIRAPIGSNGTISQELWPNPDGVRVTYYNVTFELYNGSKAHLVDGGPIEVPAGGGTYALSGLLGIVPTVAVSPTVQDLLDGKADVEDVEALEDQIANIAVASGNGPYASVADGLAATSDGDVFTAYDGDRFVGYQNDGGTAVELSSFASLEDVDEVRNVRDIASYDTPADAIGAALAAGRKVINVDEDYATAQVLPDRASVIFTGSGSFTGVNQDTTNYRRQVIPELSPSAAAVPDLDMSEFIDLSRKTNIKVVVTGDSLTTWKANQVSQADGLTERIRDRLIADNPDKIIDVVGRGIGGQKWDNLFDKPAPEVAALYPWYTDTGAEWLDYIELEEPDVLFISLGMNDRQIFNRSAFEGVLSKINAFGKVPHVVLCTPMVPTLSPHANFSVFGEYADQEGRDYNAGYVRTYAKFNGYQLLDINRTFNMVRDGRDILRTSFSRVADDVVSPADNWQADAENACRSWSAIVNVESGAWTSAETFHCTLSGGAGNVIFIRDNGSGFIEFKVYSGSSGLYDTVTTDIPTPVADVDVEITLDDDEFRFRIYEDQQATQPVTVNVIRYGGLYRPTIGFLSGAAGAVNSVQFYQGTDTPVMPLGTDLDIWGVQNATGELDEDTGGGGPNHPTSLGAELVYGTHMAAQSFKLPHVANAEVDFRSVLLSTTGANPYDFGDSAAAVVTAKMLTTVAGVNIPSISDGNFVGQRLDIINAGGSAGSIEVLASAIEGNGVVLAPANGILLFWDGTSWVRRTDTLSEGDVSSAVATALASYDQLNNYSDSFTPVLSFSSGGSFGGTAEGEYTVTGDTVRWWIRYSGAVTIPASVGSFEIDFSDIGSTPNSFKTTATVGFLSGISKGDRSGETCIGLIAAPAAGAATVEIQKMYKTVGNQNLLSTDFSTSVTINISGEYQAT